MENKQLKYHLNYNFNDSIVYISYCEFYRLKISFLKSIMQIWWEKMKKSALSFLVSLSCRANPDNAPARGVANEAICEKIQCEGASKTRVIAARFLQ